MRGWTPGMTGAATVSTNAVCTSPISMPNHQVKICAAWKTAT
jgi:hypothetical protein